MDPADRRTALIAFIATAKPVMCAYCGSKLSEDNPVCRSCAPDSERTKDLIAKLPRHPTEDEVVSVVASRIADQVDHDILNDLVKKVTMDPDANLAEQRRLAEHIAHHIHTPLTKDVSDLVAGYAARLAELVIALDEWISRGGFYPKDWTKQRPKPKRK